MLRSIGARIALAIEVMPLSVQKPRDSTHAAPRPSIGSTGVLLLVVPSIILIVLIWLPFGFHMGALLEDWGLLRIYSEVGGPIFFTGATGELAQHQMRPIMTTLWAIAYAIDPDNWWFWHAELAFSLLVKGASLTWIAHYLTGSRRWALVAGMLFVVWPADTLQMAFRAVNIGFAAGLATLSAALFVAAYVCARAGRKALLAVLGAICIVAGTWMYEVTLLMAPLPFLIMWAREGYAASWMAVRREWRVSLAWFAAVAITLGYLLFVTLTAKATYQQAVAGSGQQLIETLKTTAPMLFTRGVVRSLLGGWVDAARIVSQDLHWNIYLLVVAVAVAVPVCLAGRRSCDRDSRADAARLGRTACVGLLVILLGYAPFLVSLGHVGVSQRTYLFVASGSALVFVALLAGLDRWRSGVALTIAVLLLLLGVAQQLYQFRQYTAIHDRQREVLRAIVEQAPHVPAGKTLIVLDESQRINHVWMLSSVLHSALAYLYDKADQAVEVCLQPVGVWPRDVAGRQGRCVETADAWVFRGAPPLPVQGPLAAAKDVTIPKSDAVVVRINADGTAPSTPAVLQNRALLRKEDSAVARRYRRAIGADTWPRALRFFSDPAPGSTYRWDFGRRWNLDWPEAGSGWSEADWLYKPLRQVSMAWMILPRASLVFPLKPTAEPYWLTLHLGEPWTDGRGDVVVRVNGKAVAAAWASELDLGASIPADLLVQGMNTLEFEAPLSRNWGVSLHMDWITLAPARR